MRKNKTTIIFGINALSSLAWYCLENDSSYRVAAFTVNGDYLTNEEYEGLPVLAFEELERHYPPDSVSLLIPLGWTRINGLRMDRFIDAKSRGYGLISYVSSRASIWPDLEINENVLIYEHAVVQPFSTIGHNTIVRSSTHISHHNRIGNHVFIAAGATLGGNVTIGERAFIGLGAIVRDGVTIAPRTFVGAGAVVTADTEPDAVYVGNPAKKFAKTAMDVTARS